MAALLYDEFFIIAFGRFDKGTQRWVAIADISWHAAGGYEAHMIQDPSHTFGTKQEAEAFAVEAAKSWVDAHTKAA